MSRLGVLWCAVLTVLIAGASPANAQYHLAPDAYTITEVNSMFGPAITMQIYRDGSKVLVDQSNATAIGSQGSHLRTLYDLATRQNFTWDVSNQAVPCTGGNFSGDWGDPFAFSAEMNADLARQKAVPAGGATVNGIPTRVYAAKTPDGEARAWIDLKYGLLIRLMMGQKNGEPQTMFEVKQLSLEKPEAVMFVLPPGCSDAANAPRVPPEVKAGK
jgi:hypothetical protein